MDISARIKVIVSHIRYDAVADIGTDHAYVPIYAAKIGVAKKGFACDRNAAPLERARRNIDENGLSDIIETRMGDGFTPIKPGEASSAVLAGMGGMLIVKILKEGARQVSELSQLILSPQSDVPAVRRHAHEVGFIIDDEEVVFCDGQFYNVISCIRGEEPPYSGLDYIIGKKLMERPSPDFVLFAEKEAERLETALRRVDSGKSEAAKARKRELAVTLAAYRDVKNINSGVF